MIDDYGNGVFKHEMSIHAAIITKDDDGVSHDYGRVSISYPSMIFEWRSVQGLPIFRSTLADLCLAMSSMDFDLRRHVIRYPAYH